PERSAGGDGGLLPLAARDTAPAGGPGRALVARGGQDYILMESTPTPSSANASEGRSSAPDATARHARAGERPGGGALLEAALGHAARGWHVLQIRPRAKNPVVEAWQHVATTDPATIGRWWTLRPGCNLGVQLGPRSGILDVECDSEEAERQLALLLGEG